ncbi:hypothetical protein GMO_09560 [Gluconobacter morbifer G707]|uniref:Uncharacterized protein n=1 Tax=Gluconobacter morbifer G707 TaxID=1088869 RepID=G6XHJ0_9PROT|nr:hypothetical protein GMO_09560 [Gluconobacter morbifer G707]
MFRVFFLRASQFTLNIFQTMFQSLLGREGVGMLGHIRFLVRCWLPCVTAFGNLDLHSEEARHSRTVQCGYGSDYLPFPVLDA